MRLVVDDGDAEQFVGAIGRRCLIVDLDVFARHAEEGALRSPRIRGLAVEYKICHLLSGSIEGMQRAPADGGTDALLKGLMRLP